MNEQADMEIALAKDASMQELLSAIEGQPMMQKCLRMAFRVGFGAGALYATNKARDLIKQGGK